MKFSNVEAQGYASPANSTPSFAKVVRVWFVSGSPGSCLVRVGSPGSKTDFFDLRRGAWIDAFREKANSQRNEKKKQKGHKLQIESKELQIEILCTTLAASGAATRKHLRKSIGSKTLRSNMVKPEPHKGS